jgi:hypothetical protein
MWRLSGLHRHVTLRSVAAGASIGDVRVTTPLGWSHPRSSSSSSAPGKGAAAVVAANAAGTAAVGGGADPGVLTQARLCVEVLLEVDPDHLSQQQQQQQGREQSGRPPPPPAAAADGAPGAPCGLQLEVVLMSAEGQVLVPAVAAAWEQVRDEMGGGGCRGSREPVGYIQTCWINLLNPVLRCWHPHHCQLLVPAQDRDSDSLPDACCLNPIPMCVYI